MEVEFNPGLNVNSVAGQPVARQQNIQPADTTMSFERTQALQKTLQETPQVRPEAVTQASALISDENYPSDTLLNKMAGFLANKMSSNADDQR
ncbi:MAG: hypothetical protein ABSE48_11600 [Verrucomicrobiota bacterium]|jgi:hypothetical protein